MSIVNEESFEIIDFEGSTFNEAELLGAELKVPLHLENLSPDDSDVTIRNSDIHLSPEVSELSNSSISAESVIIDSVRAPRARKTTRNTRNTSRLSSKSQVKEAGLTSNDPLSLYLDSIGKHPLLTKEDEVELSILIKEGDAAKQKLQDNSLKLNSSEIRKLKILKNKGDDATEKFVNSNLRLVVSIARGYQGKGLELLDLIQEGNLGMMRAVKKFDHNKGFKFSTYASWWIRQAINRGIADKSRTIRVPVHAHDDLKSLYKTQFRYLELYRREPTVAELAEELNLTEANIINLLTMPKDTISLETPVGEEGNNTISDSISDKTVDDDYEKSIQAMVQNDQIEKFFTVLNEREKIVLSYRFGLEDGEYKNLQEIGNILGLTRERIRQIQDRAIIKIRKKFLDED